MALATQCPHCHTTFRVAHDQLKLRAGLVRCGACKQIFNGVENLLRSEEQQTPADSPSLPPASTIRTGVPNTPGTFVTDNGINSSTTVQPAARQNEPPSGIASAPDAPSAAAPATEGSGPGPIHDPLLRMTLMDFAREQDRPASANADAGTEVRARVNTDDDSEANADVEVGASARMDADTDTKAGVHDLEDGHADEPDHLDHTIDDLQRKPWRSEKKRADEDEDALDRVDTNEYEEPSFVKQGRRRQRMSRAMRLLILFGSAILLVLLIAQATYVFRDQIAVRFPQAQSLLMEACAYLGCKVELPAEIDAVSIESSELQTLTGSNNTFTLSVLLRNRDNTAQAWPYIELTLNDSNEKPIARRVFAPQEYLPPPLPVEQGFSAKSEQPVKLHFALTDLKASGYRVYLFYP